MRWSQRARGSGTDSGRHAGSPGGSPRASPRTRSRRTADGAPPTLGADERPGALVQRLGGGKFCLLPQRLCPSSQAPRTASPVLASLSLRSECLRQRKVFWSRDAGPSVACPLTLTPPCWSLQGHWRTLWWVEPVLSVPCPGALGPSPGFPSGWSMFPGFLSNLELLPDSVIFFGFQICVLFSVVSPIRAVALRNLIVVFVKAGH